MNVITEMLQSVLDSPVLKPIENLSAELTQKITDFNASTLQMGSKPQHSLQMAAKDVLGGQTLPKATVTTKANQYGRWRFL